MDNQIHCPKCGSTSIHTEKKGFSGKKAVIGGILTGGIGLLAGTIGSNKIVITCLNCGNKFAPGEGTTDNTAILKKPEKSKDEINRIFIDQREKIEAAAKIESERLQLQQIQSAKNKELIANSKGLKGLKFIWKIIKWGFLIYLGIVLIYWIIFLIKK